MPSDQLLADQTRAGVLSRVAEFPGLVERFAPLGKVRELYRQVRQSPEGFRLENLLAEMRIGIRVDAADQARIPASGPVVVVANHPYGMLDGAILTVLLTRVRQDVKVLTNSLLGDVPELQRHCRGMCGALRDLDELSQPITTIEADGKGLPILLRQYAKIGGKMVGFNVDRKFSNVLDGLVVVDLRQTDATVLDRYMGREDARRFRQAHGSSNPNS